MIIWLLVALAALALAIRFWDLPRQLEELKSAVARRWAEQSTLRLEVKNLRTELTELRALVGTLSRAALVAQQPGAPGPVAAPYPPPAAVFEPPVVAPEPALPPLPAPAQVSASAEVPPLLEEPATVEQPGASEEADFIEEEAIAEETRAVAPPNEQPTVLDLPAADELVEEAGTTAPTPAELPTLEEAAAPTEAPAKTEELEPAPAALPALTEPAMASEEPTLVEQEEPTTEPKPVESPAAESAARPTPPAPARLPQPRLLPPPARRRAPKPILTGPTWWKKASTMVLENWTGVLGAVVLVTGVGFLGIYAALRLAPPFRFLLICAFAVGLLGARYALRNKQFAKQLNTWLLSSAAAIFLFACVGAVSIPGLQWATPPFDYLLLLAGVSANLYLAWRASRETVATLHGVLSLVALAVLPPTGLTLGAAAGVTAFSIAITYRQQWKYQLLLSIASFFAFHLYWHQELATTSASGLRLTALALVLLVGGAAAVVQYRRVYAERQFEPRLFAAHLLNWTCLGINLYLYSTGSVWKTIPLALGAGLTFWAGRQAKRLGIGWLFQTDTLISLILALATALSLQGWHATNPVILLFMLLETLLVALVMARQREALVYRVAMAGALLAGGGLLLLAGGQAAANVPAQLYRDALVLGLAGGAALAFTKLIYQQPLLQIPAYEQENKPNGALLAAGPHHLLPGLAGLAGLLQAGTGLLLARALFAGPHVPVTLLLVALVALAGGALGLAAWVRAGGHVPNWVRWQQLGLGQFLVVLALVGLHEMGLAWSGVLLVLFAENLLVLLVLAGRDPADHLHGQVYRAALAEAFLAGAGLLLVAGRHFADHAPTLLYREALLLVLAGWAGVAFVQLAFKLPFLRLVRPALRQPNAAEPLSPASNQRACQGLVSGFAGLAGLLQVGAGALLGRALFGWQPAPVGLLLGALVGLAGSALALAYWVRTLGVAPDWVRRQQLVLGQFFLVLAVFGLHEVGLGWSEVVFVLFAENLLVALLLAGRDGLLHRAALAAALLVGASLLAVGGSHLAHGLPPVLYRNALLLALAGWASMTFIKFTHKRPFAPAATAGPAALAAPTLPPSWLSSLLGGFAGLAGFLQAGAGLLLAQVLFGWSEKLPILLLLGLAGAALGLAYWVHARAAAPRWVRRQQLVLAQAFTGLALVGLHQAGLSWPGVLVALYAENLLAALLLSGRDEDGLLHLQTYLLVLQAGLLPVLVRATAPSALPPLTQAGLLLGAALLTLGYQARRLFSASLSEDYACLPLTATDRLPLLSGASGWLLLGAGSLEYTHTWAGWAMVGLLAALLYLRQRAAVPGLWAALVLAATGYVGLQWAHVLSAAAATHFAAQPALGAGQVLRYLLPTLAVPGLALRTSRWPTTGRYLRGPWLYLLGLHLVVALLGSVPPAHHAYLILGLLALAATAFAAAQAWRHTLPDAAAVAQAGRPDRYLLHLSYGLLVSSLLCHLRLLAASETLFHQPAEYFTAAAFFGVLAAMAVARPPATAPVYASWRVLHPWLPEAALLFGTFTLAHHLRAPWLPLLWAGAALALSNLAAAVPLRFRRLGLYGRLYYWLAALSASATCLLYVSPTQLLSPEWWALTTAVALLFGYVGLALRVGNAPYANLSPAWRALAQLPPRQFEALLLYPAFVTLSLLFIQSFDRSVLTVLLMLEVVAVFSTSLLLRRQDLRYVALAGMVGCLVRLVFFDLSRSGTITRAIVFIFMGLLLLGMNALYARFKARFEPELAAADAPDHSEDEEDFLPDLPDEEALAPE